MRIILDCSRAKKRGVQSGFQSKVIESDCNLVEVAISGNPLYKGVSEGFKKP